MFSHYYTGVPYVNVPFPDTWAESDFSLLTLLCMYLLRFMIISFGFFLK